MVMDYYLLANERKGLRDAWKSSATAGAEIRPVAIAGAAFSRCRLDDGLRAQADPESRIAARNIVYCLSNAVQRRAQLCWHS